MMQGKAIVIVLAALIIGFGAGFALRPVIMPVEQTAILADPPIAAPVPAEPRGKQYFAANLDKARQVATQCAEGSVRGDECSNAEQAIAETEGKDRFRRFMGN